MLEFVAQGLKKVRRVKNSKQAPSIAERIHRDLGAMTPHERRAAQRLLADYPVAGLDTVARFGEKAGVSGPTVLRMIAKIGFASYGAFQAALRAEVGARLATPLMKGGDRLPDSDRLARFATAAIDNIRETAANIPRHEFDAVTRLLGDGRRPVSLVGGRFTDPVAEYLAAHLRVIRPNVRRVGGRGQTLIDHLLDIGKRDVVAIFDIRRYSDDIAEFATQAAGRGATVVLFTDQWLSPVSRVARHVLPAHIEAPSALDSSAGIILLVEALLAAIASEPESRRRLARLETIRKGRA